jgi:hypothetical protein
MCLSNGGRALPSLLTSVSGLCHQSSQQNSFHRATVLKFVAAKNFLHYWQEMTADRRQIRAVLGMFKVISTIKFYKPFKLLTGSHVILISVEKVQFFLAYWKFC